MRFRTVTLLSAVSAGLGAWINHQCEKRNRGCCAQTVAQGQRRVVSLPAVSAATYVPSPVTSIVPGGQNRTAEIMKHGFPGHGDIKYRDDYVLSYDRRNRVPNWVFEHLTPDKVRYRDGTGREKSSFQEDPSVHHFFRATNEDYRNSGYDRGHMAAAANHRWSQQVMDQTFLLTNTAPQVGEGFNRDAWNALEQFARHQTKYHGDVYVCTGPLYLPRRELDGKLYVKYEVIGQNHIAVPTHFFKVIVSRTNDGKYELLSFVLPNQVLPENVNLKNYLVPIEFVERASGLLLFDKLPRNTFHSINFRKQ